MTDDRVVVILSPRKPKDSRQKAEKREYRFASVDGPLRMYLGSDMILSEIENGQPRPLGSYDPLNGFDFEPVTYDDKGLRCVYRLKPIDPKIARLVLEHVTRRAGVDSTLYAWL